MSGFHRLIFAAWGCLLLALIGCGQSASGDKIQVVVSILPQAEFVESVGGDRVQVTVMIPPGGSPATYEPTPGQLRALTHARLYVRIGPIPFEEAWMQKMLRANPKLEVVNMADGVEILGHDPHFWNSPRTVRRQLGRIYRGLLTADPEYGETYRTNMEAYADQLTVLDQQIQTTLAGLRGREFMVFHPVWGYFAQDYGLEQIAIEEEGKEPSAADIAALIELARNRRFKTIFVQPQFTERHAQVIAEQIGARLVPIDPLAPNYRENLLQVAQILATELREVE